MEKVEKLTPKECLERFQFTQEHGYKELYKCFHEYHDSGYDYSDHWFTFDNHYTGKVEEHRLKILWLPTGHYQRESEAELKTRVVEQFMDDLLFEIDEMSFMDHT
jgi:hypothetical protein